MKRVFRRSPLGPAALILPLALLLTAPHAQQRKSRVGFVDVQQVVAKLPGSATYLKLSQSSDKDLKAKQDNLQKLAAKASKSRSAADKQALAKAQQAYVNAQKGYQQRLAAEFRPLSGKINAAVASAAKSNGFSVVLARRVAAQSKLVVYANSSATDLTPAVLKVLKK
ncbi:OmpH family outer membrane protein [Deinococcus hopiensis]|jgi:outer membrane protein|uniref:Periplasmic chaperone for outer membrane proteins Skp n=1 Tax=Deinococcus hopiensis KR-140 TaxID=695939 RepID=A0A1W1VL90_9DEIO|nr:OmpH family outer membrane protein [Deinococcus hopiensis]SMB93821.1 periplasmic chaperone for outer membrane proteins Skp [Deinococcus hopiensis KR-140]